MLLKEILNNRRSLIFFFAKGGCGDELLKKIDGKWGELGLIQHGGYRLLGSGYGLTGFWVLILDSDFLIMDTLV